MATDLAGDLVDQLGIVWAHETAAELGRDRAEVAGAFWAARQVIGAEARWAELEQRSAGLSADAEAALHAVVSDGVSTLARAYLTRPGELRIGQTIVGDGPLADEMVAGGAGEATKTEEDYLVALGVDREVAQRFVVAASRARIGQAAPVARATGRSVVEAAEAIELVRRAAGLERLDEAIDRALAVVPAPTRLTAWQGRALRDDLGAWQEAAATAALARPLPVPEAVAAWVSAHEVELGRAALLSGAAPQDSPDPLAVTSLALRRLQLAL